MPTVLRAGPYRFFFYAGDSVEPPIFTCNLATFWLEPIRLQRSDGFARVEIGRMQKLVARHQTA